MNQEKFLTLKSKHKIKFKNPLTCLLATYQCELKNLLTYLLT
jgi:hypothetical protein